VPCSCCWRQAPLLLLAQNRFLRDPGAELAAALTAQATAQALTAADGLPPAAAGAVGPGAVGSGAAGTRAGPTQRAGGKSGALVLHACALALLAAQADPNATNLLGLHPLFASVLANGQPFVRTCCWPAAPNRRRSRKRRGAFAGERHGQRHGSRAGVCRGGRARARGRGRL
jgi:hypothetical protein